MRNLIEFLVLGVVLSCICGPLPIYLTLLALCFLVISNPRKFRYILLASFVLVIGKSQDTYWNGLVRSYECDKEWV